MESCWRSRPDGLRYSLPWIETCPQNLVSYPIAVIVLCAKANRLVDLKPLVPKLMAAMESVRPGFVEFIDAD